MAIQQHLDRFDLVSESKSVHVVMASSIRPISAIKARDGDIWEVVLYYIVEL
jgi:hypothetical protein